MTKADIGIIGLGVMGRSLALQLSQKNWKVSVYDEYTPELVKYFKKSAPQSTAAFSIEEFVNSLEKPHIILLMVKAGKPVDDYLQKLLPYLSTEDIIIDGGNSYFKDSIIRYHLLKKKDIHFVGMGISGGEYGALTGASLMPGGSHQAWKQIEAICKDIAAKTNEGEYCCRWIGPDGAGHFVKTVHNGIEYGVMQIIAEGYHILKDTLCFDNDEIYDVFSHWNEGTLNSYLLEITLKVLKKKEGEHSLVDRILDTAAQKGTGKWTSQIAMDLGVAIPTISSATQSRFLSALKHEREKASKSIQLDSHFKHHSSKEEVIDNLYHSIHNAIVCAYAQGFALMKRASDKYSWDLKLDQIALIWLNGCIIRSKMLYPIKEAFTEQKTLSNLLIAPYFREKMKENHKSWRSLISLAVMSGVAIPTISSSLSYFDSYRSAWLPANILQAQRDYFGAHTYQRTDKKGIFHTKWDE